MSNKKNLCQFFTTRSSYVAQGMNIPEYVNTIIEPFAGNKDLLKAFDMSSFEVELYDADPKHVGIIERDTLQIPPDYTGKFIITNPPYLARNKSKNKSIYNNYGQNDLYKCFLISILGKNVLGGIIVIPLNFWCSVRKNVSFLRRQFLSEFNVLCLNIFEERVFEDTAYSVCCFQFEARNSLKNTSSVPAIIFPTLKKLDLILDNDNDYTIGGEIYKLPQNPNIKVERLTTKNLSSEYITNIKLYALDSNSKKKIRMEMVSVKNRFIDTTVRLSERSFATLIVRPVLKRCVQEELVIRFNRFIEKEREKYNSLFLSNYRESSDIARKRISFSLVYRIVNYLLSELLSLTY